MFAIPTLINGVPSLSIAVPGFGTFIAAVLIAALVGSALGVLREATSPHTRAAAPGGATALPDVDHDDHHEHREAA